MSPIRQQKGINLKLLTNREREKLRCICNEDVAVSRYPTICDVVISQTSNKGDIGAS